MFLRALALSSLLAVAASADDHAITVRGHGGTGQVAESLTPIVHARDEAVRDALGVERAAPVVVDVVKDLGAAGALERPWRLPEWAAGAARPNDREIVLMLGGRTGRHDVPRTLTHELAHVALHDATGGVRVPRWFDEGTARFLAGEHGVIDERALAHARIARARFDLDALSASFPADSEGAARAYAISARAIRILVDRNGTDVLARIADRVEQGVPFKEALLVESGLRPWELSRETWQSVSLASAWGTVFLDVDPFTPVALALFSVGAISARRRRRERFLRLDDDLPRAPIGDIVVVRWRVRPRRLAFA